MSLRNNRLPQTLNLKNTLIKSIFFRVGLMSIVLIILFTVAWLVVTEQNTVSQRVENQKLSELNGLMQQIESLRAQVSLHSQYSEKYKILVRKGVVQQQNRVSWVDSMVKLQQTLVMPAFNFKFSPETALTSAHFMATTAAKMGFHFSQLELNMGLQHEADLLTFLEEFSTQVTPLFLVERCHFEAQTKVFEQTDQVSFNLKQANIKADCVLTVFHPHA